MSSLGIFLSLEILLLPVVCFPVHADIIDHRRSRLRSSSSAEHDQQKLVTESQSTSLQHSLLSQEHSSAQVQIQSSVAESAQRQHPGPPQRHETPGSRMSRAIPDEWEPAVCWFLTIVLMAFFYKRLALYVPDLDPSKVQDPSLNFKEWRHDLFDCCGEPFFCLMALIFPSISLADNLTKTRLGAFFATVIVSALLIALNFMVLILPWCAFAMYCTFHRQRLRNAFEMEQDDGSMWTDCLLYLFCNPCTLTQDARHIQEAAQAGHPAVERDRRGLRMYFS